jgi:predicted amidohydrolase YtcJ
MGRGSWAWVLLAGCVSARSPLPRAEGGSGRAEGAVDRLFVGGTVLTLEEDQPEAEALLVRNGRILAAGPRGALERLARPGAQVTELDGAVVLPGFIDAHGHMAEYVSLWSRADLSPPPVGQVRTLSDLVSVLRCELAASPPAPGEALVAFGYDDSQLAERRHPTRAELDAVSTEVPVVALHASGKLAVVNGAALSRLGLSRHSGDPSGGSLGRGPDGELDGLLAESATGLLAQWLTLPEGEDALRVLESVQRWYASHGITTAQEDAARLETVTLLREAAARGGLLLDVVACPLWTELAQHAVLRNAVPRVGREPPTYERGFRVGGVKLVVDGSPQGRTAWLTEPYRVPPPARPQGWRGIPVTGPEELARWVDEAWQGEVQLQVHASGDAALDALLDAVWRARRRHGPKDLRPVAVSAQLARYDQVDEMGALGVVPSFSSAHAFYDGDWYREILGEARAERISLLRYALSKGTWATHHADAPVGPPDMLRLLWSSVARETRSGHVLGAAERVSVAQGLEALTKMAAWQLFEEAEKGTLTPGKRADLVVLSGNPLLVPVADLPRLTVVETVKDGRTVYRAEEGKPRGPGGRCTTR